MAFGLGPDHIVKELDDIIEGLATVEYSDEMDAEGLEAANDYTDEQIAALSGGGIVGWHEIARGEFLMSQNFSYGPQVNRPTSVGQVAGHGAIDATSPPMPVYHLAETSDGAGGTKLYDLSGDEFIMEESGATDYRATATIGGEEYPVALNSSSLRVTDPDGMKTEHVSTWTFTAFGITGTAPERVELVFEAFGAGGKDDLVHESDLTGLASEAYVDSAVDSIEIPSIDGLATVEHSDEMDAEVLAKANDYTDGLIAAEHQHHADGDAALEQKITEEHQHRIDGDAELEKKLNEEAATRKQADDDLQQGIDRLEGVTHRAEWTLLPVAVGDPLDPGSMSWRDPGGMGWAGVMQVRIHHEDLGGRVHPMGTIQEGNLWLIEWADEKDVVQGSAVYIVGTIRSNSGWIDFDPASMVHASGQPPAIDSGSVMKLVFTPADSGSGDYWTKTESDGRYLAKGSSTAIQLSNGSTKAQSDFATSGHSHSGYAASGHTHSGYASSSHKHDNDYVKGNYSITKSNGNFYIS